MEKKGGYVNSYDTNTGYNSNTGYNTENGYRTNYTNQQTVYYSNQQQYPVVYATSPPQQPSGKQTFSSDLNNPCTVKRQSKYILHLPYADLSYAFCYRSSLK